MWRRSLGAHDTPLQCPSHVILTMPLITPLCHKILLTEGDGSKGPYGKHTGEHLKTGSVGNALAVLFLTKELFCIVKRFARVVVIL